MDWTPKMRTVAVTLMQEGYTYEEIAKLIDGNASALGVPKLVKRLQERGTVVTKSDEEFRVLVIPGHTKVPAKKEESKRKKRDVPPPRYKSMAPGEDWTNIWPAAHTFKWSVVPFPVRQGYVEKSENDGITPSKYANAELMKIPNFLHLTPAHIKKHCEAIKEFCSDWPEGLETDEKCEKHFPVEIITRDYLFDGASIRDDRARPVTLRIKLSSLDLDYHARDKIIRLAGAKYDKASDSLIIETDRCPLKKQNYEYVKYLLTALYMESWRTEEWEADKSLSDMEKYFWDLNKSRADTVKAVKMIKQKSSEKSVSDKQQTSEGSVKQSTVEGQTPDYISLLPAEPSDEDIVTLPQVKEYKWAVEELINEEESLKTLDLYKKSVKKLRLNSKQLSHNLS